MTQRSHDHDQTPQFPAPPMDVADPADFLTNLPGLLGYYPTESLVLVVGDRFLSGPGPVLVRPLDDDISGALDCAAGDMAEEGHERADVYVVSESWGRVTGTAPGDPGPAGAAADAAAEVLGRHGLHLGGIAGVARLRPGAEVTDFDGEPLGRLGEPAACWASGLLHRAGEIIAPDADALAERFRPDPPETRIAAAEAQRRARDDVRRTGRDRAGAGATAGGAAPVEAVRAQHLEWIRLVDAVDCGDVAVEDALSDVGNLTVLARPLISLLLRDVTMCEILGDAADTVRVLWLGCARLFRGTARANALACYAIDRYLNGNAGIAKAALDAALDTDPGHSLSQLLYRAMASGRGEDALTSMLRATTAMLADIHPGGVPGRPGRDAA